MCVNPVTISRAYKDFNRPLFYLPRLSRRASAILHQSVPYASDVCTVPCGKCIECLQRRQMDLAVRCMREASKRGSMVFVTLTYDEASLPFMGCLERESIDLDTGEVVTDLCELPRHFVRPLDPLLDDEDSSRLLAGLRDEFSQMALSPRPRYCFRTVPSFSEDVRYRVRFTPSLHRRDVRLWLKRCRVDYEREFSVKLPDFSYVCVGEYGPKTCRPHYHLAFFGLPEFCVRWMVSRWSYGGQHSIETVNAVNEDGTNGFELASKYIGKYMSKGEFEAESVSSGYAERPRLMLSKNLGTDLSPELVSYFRCEDLFPKLSLNYISSDGKPLSVSQLKKLWKETARRSFFTFGETPYSIPQIIVKKLWYFYDQKTSSFRASPLRRALSYYTNVSPVERYKQTLSRCKGNLSPGEFAAKVSAFESRCASGAVLINESRKNSLRSFYASSVF